MKRINQVLQEILMRLEINLDRRPPPIDLEIDCSCRVKERHFACIDTSIWPPIIFVCEDLEQQGIATIRGVLAHEVGHLLYDIWHIAPWEKDPERGADEAAELAIGWTIYYDSETLIQRAGPGARGIHPRPKKLW